LRDRLMAAGAAPVRDVLRRGLMAAGLLAGLPLLALWGTGGLDTVAAWAADGQREAQNALAGAIRRLRGGDPWAFGALMALAFAYGVFHAAGPGHGKLLIGGYGVARRVAAARLAGLALVSSLAQATVAVALVYAGVTLLGWTRERMTGLADGALLAASHAAVAGLGLWLAWRGLRGLRRQAARPHPAHHDHAHHHGADCADCGHRHGPTAEEVARVSSPREAAALIAGVAMRPCTGALFLLILTWQMGIGAAGIAGAYAMGLGTALVTAAVAGLSVWAREGTLATLAAGRIGRALPVLEMTAGLAIAAVSLSLLARSV
jgi:ABC-type nickel/cobalt efflux system permease component RcnA